MKFLRSLFFLSVVLSLPFNVMAQAGATPVQCGTIIESEFTENRQIQQYELEMAPGDQFEASVTPLGDLLLTSVVAVGPSELPVASSPTSAGTTGTELTQTPTMATGVLSAHGTYIIFVANTRLDESGDLYGYGTAQNGGVGIYTLYIGCTLRDGTVIAPGDAPSTGSGEFSEDATSVNVPFSGFGFPGLPSVDFADAIAIPFQMGDIPNVGSIAPSFESVFGFSFEGSAGDTFALNFARLSGNLSLNLTVLSANNEVAYQASLVTSSSMSSTFTLPSSGTYTVGVSKSTVGAPATPENTTFQLTGTLNP